MSQKHSTVLAVIGPSDASALEAERAAQVGRLIAANGWVLITGGRGGVMEAASQGAAEAGGLVIGILPGSSAREANPHVQVAILTGLSEARNAIIALTAAAVVAVGKGYGTLAEIGFALKLGRPIASLGSWEVDPAIFCASTAEEAVAFVRDQLAAGG